MPNNTERSYIMVKPDGVQRALVGEILCRFEKRGFKIVALKLVHATKEHLEKHYADLSDKPFFPGLIKYMASGPVVAIVIEGLDAVKTGRAMLGSTSAGSSSVNEDGSRISSKSSNVESLKNLGGRFVRKQKGEENVAAVLNDRDAEDALRTAAYAAQYEDEYDDSFDDLGAHIADGVEETEILVDLARSKSLLGAAVDSERSNKMSTGGKSDGLSKGTWPVNNGGTHETRATSARETSSRSTDTQRKAQLQPARGRGRGRRDEPRGQFFVKDGKNYSYKVTGSVGVSSAEEAEALNRVEEETIHGLRQGGNMPVFKQQAADGKNSMGTDTHTNSRSIHGDLSGRGGAAHNRGRGGPRKEYDNHHRKDRAMKKHFAGIGGL